MDPDGLVRCRGSDLCALGVRCVRKMSHAEGAENAEVSGWLGGGTEVQDRLGPFLSTDVTDCAEGHPRFLPRNAQKPASRDAEGSLNNSPSDSILAILPPQRNFGRGADGCAKPKFPIAFRVRRSRFPRLPWFDSPMRVGGTAGLVGGIDCSIIISKTETPTAAIVEKTCSFKSKGISSSVSSRKMSSGT